jgi:ribosomal protein S18 acetylase RimI-like enzyme
MTSTSDWDALVLFDRQCYPAALCVEALWYRKSYEKGYISWLLLIDGKIIGNFQLREHDNDSRYIAGIAVLPDQQGQGLGRQLLNKLIELYGEVQLVARIREDNLHSRKLFESSGFEWTHETSDEKGKWNWVRRLPMQQSNPVNAQVPR